MADRTAAPRAARNELVLFDICRDGHRPDYFRVLRRVLGGRVVWGGLASRLPLLLRARKLVCSTCDDYFVSFFLLAVARALLGRPTLGLAVRAETVFQREGLAQRVKRCMLRVLKAVPGARLVTFMPYWVEPRLARYSSDWMYDLQYWDLPWLHPPRSGAIDELQSRLRRLAAGRQVVATVGHQRRVKGVEYFMQIFCERPEVRERFLFVCVGPNWDADRSLVERFVACGGVFFDRALRDDEVRPVYALADLVWVCYRPDYDQSSGIFGRALQFDRPTLVREGSYLAALQRRLGNGGLAMPYGRPEEAARLLVGADLAGRPGAPHRLERGSGFLRELLGVTGRGRTPPGLRGAAVAGPEREPA